MADNEAGHEPAFYDDIELTLAEAWRLLEEGANGRNSPFHTPAVATRGLDGRPQVRTVVLRAAEPAEWQVRFHTDARSHKVPEIEADPRIALHAYDAERKIQLRLDCLASLHRTDDLADRVWRDSPPGCRRIYRIRPTPAQPVASPHDVAEETEGGEEAGRDEFCVVDCRVEALEFLYLSAQGQRRARFAWAQGRLSKTWLVP